MMRRDVPNHQRRELVDLSFTRVIACRVGTSFSQAAKTGDFSFVRRDRPPLSDAIASAADSSFIRGFPWTDLREFTHKELKKATDDFSSEGVIGRGGFAEVFRGTLADGTLVAIKVMSQALRQGLENFKEELRVGRATSAGSHLCLVRVIGYHFSSKGQKSRAMIVYPFMANGDMGSFTDDRQLERTPLDWPTRKRIALGAARGLWSLHELGIVHCDVKPSNFLLNENFDAHLGDFGLAKSMGLPRQGHDVAGFCRDEYSNHCDTTMVCGTIGYIPPELFLHDFHYSRKSDVYSFGVTLIQLVTGKPAIDQSEEGMHIVCRAEQLFKNGEDLTRHMHPGMPGNYDKDEAIKLIQLGLVCTEDDPKKRPLMSEVIAIMEGSIATLPQRWDNYEYHGINHASNPITGSGYIDETPTASDFYTDEEELGENDDGMILTQGNRRMRQTTEVETELSEMRDRVHTMELNHQAEMEEMRQKQIVLMQTMEMMRERHTQQVNDIRAQIDRLTGFAEP